MLKVALVGLGKMGISHLSIVRPHPLVEMVGVCDASGLMLDLLDKQTELPVFTDYAQMLREATPDAVIIATPSHLHADMVRAALMADAHVFCEKPFVLDPAQGVELQDLAQARGLVTQVGYHNRFVATFALAKQLIADGVLGRISGGLAEAYGPVVLKPRGASWRTQKAAGGGCLYDYAAHPVDLLTWYFGSVRSVRGSSLRTIFSREVDDAVSSVLEFDDGVSAQLCVNWSDGSQRKMTTSITLWGTHGRLRVDRQELQVFLTPQAAAPAGFNAGWNVKYTTELSKAPWFYVRGEEYSEQIDTFVRRAVSGDTAGVCTFASATRTDAALAMIRADAAGATAGSHPASDRSGGSVARRSRARGPRGRFIGAVGQAVRWAGPRVIRVSARAGRPAAQVTQGVQK